MGKQPLLKPAPLRPGDTVGIIAPASNVDRDAQERGCERLRALGYKPFYFDSIFEQDLYFAGSVERRVRELHDMFARPEVRAIVCARGGYGCNYLLDKLDLDLIRRNPKIFVGYSDITALLTYLHDATGLVTFHGPMVAKDFGSADGVHELVWRTALGGQVNAFTLGDFGGKDDLGIRPLAAGTAEGVLYGGCLSILVASLGTPYECPTKGKLLFLEDMNEKPFQIDRMLMQLGLAGKLSDVRGIVFGEMLGCTQQPSLQSGWGTRPDQDYTLEQVVGRVLRRFLPNAPVAIGLRSGHVSGSHVTIPIGVHARLEVTAEAKLWVLESPTAMTPEAAAAWNACAPEAWKA